MSLCCVHRPRARRRCRWRRCCRRSCGSSTRPIALTCTAPASCCCRHACPPYALFAAERGSPSSLLFPCQNVHLPGPHVNLARLFAGPALVCPTQPSACLLSACVARLRSCISSRACRACVKQGSCGEGRCAFVCTDESQSRARATQVMLALRSGSASASAWDVGWDAPSSCALIVSLSALGMRRW